MFNNNNEYNNMYDTIGGKPKFIVFSKGHEQLAYINGQIKQIQICAIYEDSTYSKKCIVKNL